MKQKIVSLRRLQIERQYRTFFQDINNYNFYLKLVGTAPKNIVEFKKSKLG